MNVQPPVQIPFHCLALMADTIARELSGLVPPLPLSTFQRATRQAASHLIESGHIIIIVNKPALLAHERKLPK
jgi:hypothetical protein